MENEDNGYFYEVGSGALYPSERLTRAVSPRPPARATNKRSITSAEFMQLTGLYALAQKHNAMLEDIMRSAFAITGEEGPHGHTSDAMYGEGPDMMQLLNRLGLKIED